MNKKFIFLLIASCSISSYFFTQKQAEPEINFYDITFLRNSPIVERVLKSQGFFEVDCQTYDGLKINTIMLDQSDKLNVQTTIISMPGFVPGNKEGMSTLYAMLEDQPYNFLFIDSRGHGKSDGELLTYHGIKEYGQSQYLDIVAALEFIYKYNKEHNIPQHIIIHGLCSGAFHTIKAIAYLKKNNLPAYQAIKGIVLDSAWPSIPAIVDTVLHAEAEERCKSYAMPFLQPYVASALIAFYNYCFKEEHLKQGAVLDLIPEIEQPILFIHAQEDKFVPIDLVHPLIANTQKAQTWFVKNSSHVNSHLQYKEEYTDQLQNFIQSTIMM